jgi:hypothetical protein
MAMKYSEDIVKIQFDLGKEYRARLAYHAKRIGGPPSQIARQAVVEHIELLDAKEISERQEKLARKGGAFIPSTASVAMPATSRNSKRPGGGLPKINLHSVPRSAPVVLPSEKLAIVKKIHHKFAAWALYTEEADGPVDVEIRMAKISLDIAGRTSNPEEAAAVLEAFQDFLRARQNARPTPVVEVPDDVPIFGDVD